MASLEMQADTLAARPPQRAAATALATNLDGLKEQIERLLDRMRIAVIFGGDKSIPGAVINQAGNPRSWKSYEAVAQDIADALSRLGFRDAIASFPLHGPSGRPACSRCGVWNARCSGGRY